MGFGAHGLQAVLSAAQKAQQAWRLTPVAERAKILSKAIDIFLTKIKPGVPGPAGLQYSTYLGLSSIYVPTALAVAADGTAYVVGYAQIGLTTSYNALQPGGYAGHTAEEVVMTDPGHDPEKWPPVFGYDHAPTR